MKPSESDMSKKPPRIATFILHWVLPPRDRDYLLGDYEESFQRKLEEKSALSASLWYWGELMHTAPAYFFESIYWRLVMLKNYLIIAFRNIRRHKGYSFISIASLALGLACCLLVSSIIFHELSYDDFHENAQNIYRVNEDIIKRGEQNYESWTPGILKQAMKDEFPEILYATRYNRLGSFLVSVDDKSFYERGIVVDNDFFQMFSFQFVKGDKKTALTEPYSIVITEEIAEKYFPDVEPIGKLLTINNEHDLQVTGVIKNIPSNSSMQFSTAVSNKAPFDYLHSESWRGLSTQTYVQLDGITDVDIFSAKIENFTQKHIAEDVRIRLFLEPLSELRLSGYVGSMRRTLYMYSICAFAILLIACVNFINLSTARAASRAKEIGIRKVVGAFRKNVAAQFLGESLILSFISFLASIALAGILLPIFKGFINLDTAGFTFLSLVKPKVILAMIGVTFFTGIASGSYPAIKLSGYKSVKIFKGQLNRTSRGFALRKILVVMQFGFSIFMIASTLIVFNQLTFMKNKEIGYNKEQIVNITLRQGSKRFYQRFKNQLLINSRILGVGGISSQLPYFWQSSNENDWEGKRQDYYIEVAFSYIDYHFLQTLGIKLSDGRYFSENYPTDSNCFIVNETLEKEMGKTSAIGRRLTLMGQTGNVIGVMKDFIFRPLNDRTFPLAFMLDPEKVRFVSIRIPEGEIASSLVFIKKTWEQTVPAFPFIYSFLDEDFDRSFKAIETLGSLLTTSTLISIFIACLGLLGLASNTTQQRTKEIGVRKVLGASVSGIIFILLKDFIRWVLIATIIATPIAYLVLNNWLQSYAYRTSIGIGVFLLTSTSAIIIAGVTISYQSISAARKDPVDSMRYE